MAEWLRPLASIAHLNAFCLSLAQGDELDYI